MENKRKHLEFIQTAIGRMASNLFFLKGWTITLVSALFAISFKEGHLESMYVAYMVIFIFWILDGYFLSRERMFRWLYNEVRELKEGDVDLSMTTSKCEVYKENGWFNSMCSTTLLWFYLPLILVMFAIINPITICFK